MHHRRLADYADSKARETVAWFDHHAPGYRTAATIRHALNARIVLFHTQHYPHARFLASEQERASEHWRK